MPICAACKVDMDQSLFKSITGARLVAQCQSCRAAVKQRNLSKRQADRKQAAATGVELQPASVKTPFRVLLTPEESTTLKQLLALATRDGVSVL